MTWKDALTLSARSPAEDEGQSFLELPSKIHPFRQDRPRTPRLDFVVRYFFHGFQ
jgi:hypothetical protein